MPLPSPVPEFPVSDLRAAQHFYATKMGFTVDWTYENESYQLSGISRDAARIFLRRRTAEEQEQRYSVLVWLNLDSSAAVDRLHDEWTQGGVTIVDPLETKPWNLREFTTQDPDGNRFRVFYDRGGDRA